MSKRGSSLTLAIRQKDVNKRTLYETRIAHMMNRGLVSVHYTHGNGRQPRQSGHGLYVSSFMSGIAVRHSIRRLAPRTKRRALMLARPPRLPTVANSLLTKISRGRGIFKSM